MRDRRPRSLFEGPEWDDYRKLIEPDVKRFDELFRGIQLSIHLDAYENSSDLWEEDDEYRVLVTVMYPGVPELWVYYRIEDDDNVELLWVVRRDGPLPYSIH